MAFLLHRLKFTCLRHAELDRNQHGGHALGMTATVLANVCAALHTSDGASRNNPLQRQVAAAVKSRREATLPSGLVDLLFLPDLVGHGVLEASTWIPLHSEILDFFINRPPTPRLGRPSPRRCPATYRQAPSMPYQIVARLHQTHWRRPRVRLSPARRGRGHASLVVREQLRTLPHTIAFSCHNQGVGNSWCN